MDTKSALQAIEKIAETGFVGVPLSGGEPLLRDDLTAIAKEIKNYDMDVILSTNGTLLSQDRVKELKPHVDLACISLDSHVESIHDNFRGLEGAQKMTLKGIKNCLDNDIPVHIFTTLTKFNHEKLPELINFIVELGVKEIALFDLNLVGRGCIIGQELQLTLEEFKKSANILIELKNQGAARVDVLAPFNFIKDDQYVNKLTLLSGGFCNAGISTINISPDGQIQPCSRMRINLGNVLTDNLKEVWKDSPILRELRDRERLKGACGKCEYKYVCGGCRANAYAEHSDYLMEDPRCM
jgi:radical SAM protein with 4Fe4S-binding SPASM domain